MEELWRILSQRNSRLRAWRAFGVPIEGGWEFDGVRIEVRLSLACSRCVTSRGQTFSWRPDELPASDPARLGAWIEALEDSTVRRLLSHDYDRWCEGHVAPLSGTDPPEVVELYEKELLAGG